MGRGRVLPQDEPPDTRLRATRWGDHVPYDRANESSAAVRLSPVRKPGKQF